ncbi:Meckelin [Habropoda laboriosa]|uniref:Meckelin n=1 Tax=Habropoda laboriosa TaxID=597456 RepID=A0A0L7R3J2_9HYME|nr:Meckelin [Habropoda laboriosa]
MFCFVKKNVFYSLIYNINFIQIAVTNKEVFELSQPSKCKNDEYFDTVSFSCVQCDANKNLQLSADRLRCICNRFSKKIGFKDGYPVCIPCGNNAIVTIDGNDCVPCNAMCKCATNEVQIDRNSSGTLLDAMYCLPCNTNEISNWQLVRKFFFVDNISGFKISNFTTSKARKVDELSILRYIKTLNIM